MGRNPSHLKRLQAAVLIIATIGLGGIDTAAATAPLVPAGTYTVWIEGDALGFTGYHFDGLPCVGPAPSLATGSGWEIRCVLDNSHCGNPTVDATVEGALDGVAICQPPLPAPGPRSIASCNATGLIGAPGNCTATDSNWVQSADVELVCHMEPAPVVLTWRVACTFDVV